MMKITIHRGSNEIGGTCIQLTTENTSILLDLGEPLSKCSRVLDVKSLRPDAVLVSHPHQDHYGLINALDPSVPVYMGELGMNLINATRMLIGKGLLKNEVRHFRAWKSFEIGDFKVTPYLVDHSAVDSYGFLIEANGKRVFYSGDFRAHGRKSVLFQNIIKNPPKDIDLLFMEGTMMARNNDDYPTETSVEMKILETIREQENISFIITSSQNIDRIVSAYRACLHANKTLVIDIYTAWVLEQLRTVSKSVPTMDWDLVRVLTTHSQDEKLKEHAEYFGNFRNRVYRQRIHKEELWENPQNYLFVGKMSHFGMIAKYMKKERVNVIYSQWLGYLGCSSEEYFGAAKIAKLKSDPRINFVYAHTSGHATVNDLQAFAHAIDARTLIPIHTEHSDDYSNIFKNVDVKYDGILFEISRPVQFVEQKRA